MAERDVSTTLDELERKLRDLERELGAVAPAPAVAPPPVVGPDAPGLREEVDELGVFRERLARTARELEQEYARVLGRLRELAGAEEEPAAAPPEPAQEPEPEPAVVAAASGIVVVDAGPFDDLADVALFEAALAELPGVTGVTLTGFEGRRAVAELHVEGHVSLDALDGTIAPDGPARFRVDR
jgi:hypothetical protein